MNEKKITNDVEVNSSIKKHFNTVTTLSKYIAIILFIAMPFVGGWVGYMYSPEKVIVVEKLSTSEIEKNSLKENGIQTAELATLSETGLQSAIKNVHEKYGYGPGPSYIGSNEKFLWFSKPHETEGCNRYSYIELNSGKEVETKLTTCPLVDISKSYPFHVVQCAPESSSVGESLCVTNLLTLEEQKIQITNDLNETTIKKCVETDFDPACHIDIQAWDGGILARIYKSEPRAPYAIYENTELLREENINLFEEFGLE